MLPDTPQSFLDLLKQSQYPYIAILKKIFPIVLLIVLIKDWQVYINFIHLPVPMSNTMRVLDIAFIIIIAAAFIYLWAVSFFITNEMVKKPAVVPADIVSPSLKTAFSITFKRLPSIYLACLCYVIGIVALIMFARLVAPHVYHWVTNRAFADALILLMLLDLPFLIGLLLTFFTLPLLVLNDYVTARFPWLVAFKNSANLLSVPAAWPKVFLLFFCIIILLWLILPNTLHGHKIAGYYLSAPFDSIILCLILPVINNLIIRVLHDLELFSA